MTTGDSSTSLFHDFSDTAFIYIIYQDYFSTVLEQSTVEDVMTTKGRCSAPFS